MVSKKQTESVIDILELNKNRYTSMIEQEDQDEVIQTRNDIK